MEAAISARRKKLNLANRQVPPFDLAWRWLRTMGDGGRQQWLCAMVASTGASHEATTAGGDGGFA
uniref:Uncharacterized protein n=1 Tax=Oryza sativa subsp. indica TaxID=39946 RepID=A0A8F3ADK4_ORYSI|nr:hypothetical protein Xa7_IRBB7.10 [Oryza sativa Indica Group]